MNESMIGKTVLITGATSGIGYHTAKGLVSKGANLFITGRDEKRGQIAIEKLCDATNHRNIHFIQVDHSTIKGNNNLAQEVMRHYDRLDVLINNVGGLFSNRIETSDKHEMTLAMNVLGPFVLTKSLQDMLCDCDYTARIINVTSSAHSMWSDDPFKDLRGKDNYIGINIYARAKLLNLIWTMGLSCKLRTTDVTVNAVNPGMAWTPNTQSFTPEAIPNWKLLWPIVRWFQRKAKPEKASKGSIYLASSKDVNNISGSYFESNTKAKLPSSKVMDRVLQEKTWGVIENMVS